MAASQALREALAGRYRIDEEAGSGGMATVFLAEDLKHHRRVAIKVLSPELAGALGPERFLREIEIVSRISHPHVLPLFDSGAAGDSLFYVMPYVEGDSLRRRIEREGQLPLEDALRIAGEVADALAVAHAQGVVHRDIKPANILLQDGHALVADFGLARAVEAVGADPLTRTGVVLGTPGYMSPEQGSGGRTDARTDVYALGCVLYEMLAGQPPFVGPSADVVMYQHLSVEAPPVTNVRAGVPPAIVTLVARALAKAPSDRFADAGRFAEALAAARAAPQEAPRGRDRGGVAMWRWAAVALMLAGLAGAWMLRTAGCARPASASIRSLAVLPLENFSGDASQEYFVDGVTEELINHLSQIAALRVISRTSVMTLKGMKLSVPDVAKRLHVDAVVEGSVSRVGEQVKISAALVQSAPERQLWSKSFELPMRDILTVQVELAGAISDELRLRLTPAERRRVAQPRAVDPRAHDEYLQGRYSLNRQNEATYRLALQHFQRAVEIDPLYAQGWSGVADAYYYLSNLYLPAVEAMPLAREAAKKALSIDSTLAEAHASLGVVLSVYDWDWQAAEREFRRSLELNPSQIHCRHYLSALLTATGKFDEAISQLEEAQRLDPLSGYLRDITSYTCYLAGRLDRATAVAKEQIMLDPTDATAHLNLGQVYLEQGRYDGALEEIQRSAALADNPYALGLLANAYARAGRRGEALATLDTLLHRLKQAHVGSVYLALAYDGLGDTDHAFAWLDQALKEHDEELMYVFVDRKFRAIRKDPRFAKLKEQFHQSMG